MSGETRDETMARARRARLFLRRLRTGVLATMSLELPGYPFGSITPFALTHEGRPLIQVSDIAQHTRNMLADPKVSLIAAEEGGGNAQARGRITVVGDARPVPTDEAEAMAERYQAAFPESRAYSQAHGFSYFQIEPRRIRFIGGFGDIFWVEAEDWLLPRPEWAADESAAVAHMNEDHREALAAIAARFLDRHDAETRLVACDPEGCELVIGGDRGRVDFESPALDRDGLRRELVALARRARASD
ncbi:MAG: DUF2470 domain-containing protein [Planctomycetes bacterium]|nr:DUF2470 domain-containing protein [Planctomycetota bacterium]